jgi:tetratricopeptide (TPR) repeat protein
MSEPSRSKPDEYDSTTDYHYLKFENRCLRGSGDDFQKVFEEIMVRARPGEFERVRPYGRFGDRKCDGLIESEGIVFQVYSPDELKQAEVQKKIDEDLEGAVQHWSDILKKWVFVYNARRGTSSDIQLTLQQKQKQYPEIEIDSWSNDYLWEITRRLSLQQRSEILGASPQWNVEKPKSKAYIPNLPFHFLKRSTDLDTLKNLVLSSSNQSTGITRSALRVGVYGMGGIGKSVLAAMLARDPEVRAAFPDGIFWITLGQEPPILARQLDLARSLGNASLPLQDVQQGKIHLSQLLGDKTCLLILDDVWKADHIDAFNILGEQSGLLFTTRDSRIVKALNASEHRVDLLSDDEALELLAACSRQCQETLPIEAHEIVKECGNLPLALSMIGAIAKARPNRWDNLLHKLQNADLDKIRHEFPDYPYPDLLKAIQVSVDALEPAIKVRYLDFAVFPEDTAIPETTLRTFWEPEGLDEYDTQDVVDTLVERSLARRDENGNLSLHDLQYDYVRKQANDLTVLHNKLLAAYKIYCPQGWHTGPKDGYFFENLSHHLNQAGFDDELYTLLTACPDWMEAKFIQCLGDSSYAADLALALCNFVDSLNLKEILALIRLRTAQLVVTQRVRQYSKEDLEALVWLGRETEALSHARLTKEPTERFLKLLAIYDTFQKKNQCSSVLLDEICHTTQYIENDKSQPLKTWSLKHVAIRLHSSKRFKEARDILSIAKKTASSLHPSWIYSRVVSKVANETANNSTVNETRTFTRHWVQVDAFIQLATAFAECGYQEEVRKALDQAKQTAYQIDDSQPRPGSYRTQDHCFEKLAVAMSNLGYLEEATSVAKLINDSYHASEAWNVLVSALIESEYPQSEIDGAFEVAKQAAAQIERIGTKAIKLSQLAVVLTKGTELCKKEAENIFAKVLQLIQTISSKSSDNWVWEKGTALSALAEAYAQVGRFTDAMEIAENIEDTDCQQSVLAEIAISMIETGYFDAERVMQTIHYSGSSARVLNKLASVLAQAKEVERASELFEEAREIAFQLSIEGYWNSKAKMAYKLALALIEAKHFKAVEGCIQAIEGNVFKSSFYKTDALIKFGSALNKHEIIGKESKRILQIFLVAEQEIEAIEIDAQKMELYRELTSCLTDAGYLVEAERTSIKANEAAKRAIYVTITIEDGNDNTDDSTKIRKEYTKQLILEGCFVKAFMELDLNSLEEFVCFLSEESVAFEMIERGFSVKVLQNLLDVALWFRKDWQEMQDIVNLMNEYK